MKKKVVGLGEVLWDLLPERTCLGGAPANFAYITTLMGDQGIVASRVGEDSRGLEALRRMEELGLNIDHVQTDPQRPTGTVNVELDAKGIATFRDCSPCSLGFSGLDSGLAALWPQRPMPSVLVHWRNARTKAATRFDDSFAPHRPSAIKVFDVNLRQSYYSSEVLAESMKLADIVKLNDEELPKIMSLAKAPIIKINFHPLSF